MLLLLMMMMMIIIIIIIIITIIIITIVININPFPDKPWFLRVCGTSLLKTLWVKEKLLATSNFSFSHSVFYLFGEYSAIFIKFEIIVCKLLQCGPVWKCVVW